MKHSDRIFWIEGEPWPGLALVLRPGGTGDLAGELREMKAAGIDVMVSMQELDEAADFGLAKEGPLAEKAGITFFAFPIADHQVPPDRVRFSAFIDQLVDLSVQGKQIGVHCQGSIGRATVTAACVLMEMGWEAEAALRAIETARGCEVPDTAEQRRWILRFKSARAREERGERTG